MEVNIPKPSKEQVELIRRLLSQNMEMLHSRKPGFADCQHCGAVGFEYDEECSLLLRHALEVMKGERDEARREHNIRATVGGRIEQPPIDEENIVYFDGDIPR